MAHSKGEVQKSPSKKFNTEECEMQKKFSMERWGAKKYNMEKREMQKKINMEEHEMRKKAQHGRMWDGNQ